MKSNTFYLFGYYDSKYLETKNVFNFDPRNEKHFMYLNPKANLKSSLFLRSLVVLIIKNSQVVCYLIITYIKNEYLGVKMHQR